MMIEAFVTATERKDYRALALCFADKCRLFDYCPATVGKDNSYLYGRRAVDMFYHNKFILGGHTIHDPVIVDERTVNFYTNYGGAIVHVLATVESYDPETNLISEMVIRPA